MLYLHNQNIQKDVKTQTCLGTNTHTDKSEVKFMSWGVSLMSAFDILLN